MSTIKTTIKSKREVANGTIEITFARPRGFEFVAGQYIQVALECLSYPDSKGLSRTFSICSSPLNKGVIAIAFRNTGSGYKKTLSELSEGSEVLLEGPFGHFSMPDFKDVKHVFIAGGIGITPFLSMIKTALKNGLDSPITLLYANRDKESSAYLEDLKKLSLTSNIFSLDSVFGRIEANHVQKHKRDIDNTLWWIVGPPGMVAEVKYLLASVNIPDDKIRIEEFIGY